MELVLTMRDMKFDIDIILRNCKRFGVKVEKGDNLHGVTMNGNPFNVTDEMDKAFDELSNMHITNSVTSANVETVIVPKNDGFERARVSVGEAGIVLKERSSFSNLKAALYAA